MNELILRGPAQNSTGIMSRFIRPDIVSATMTVNGVQFDLLQNIITIRPLSGGYYMLHHSFMFIDNQKQFRGQWFDNTFDIGELKGLFKADTPTYVLTQMRDHENKRHTPTYALTLSEKGVKKIMDLV